MASRRRVVQDRLAGSGLQEHVEYLAHRSGPAALRFSQAAEQSFDQLAENPGLGAVWGFENPEIQDVRVWPIRGFRNYLIFYRSSEETLRVMRVIHGAKDIAAIFQRETNP